MLLVAFLLVNAPNCHHSLVLTPVVQGNADNCNECELLLAASFIVLCVEPYISTDTYCWEAAKRSQVAIAELLLFCKSTGVILLDALPASQRLCTNGPFEDCQVRMFVKQCTLPSANVCEAGLIAKCECFWSNRSDGSSSYMLLKIKQFCSSQNRQLFT